MKWKRHRNASGWLQSTGDFGHHFGGAFRGASGSGLQSRQDILDPFGLQNIDRKTRPDEVRRAHMREQRE
jgi:hypothetical protein